MSTEEPRSKSTPADLRISSYLPSSIAFPAAHALGPPPRPGVLASLDRFEILRLIGAGGMGFVYLARDPATPDAPCIALKVVKPELAVNPHALRRFVVEAGLMQQLEHPHIVKLLEVSGRASTPYFTMPYFPGGSLANLIQPGQALTEREVIRICRQIARALKHAHGKGITHRDLKPGNVLLDADHNAFLTDFGLALTLVNDSSLLVREHSAEGTALYKSPAASAGEIEDTRGDIYSFGALMYEMLTGRPPYEGSTINEVKASIADGPPVPIKNLNAPAPEGLVKIVETAMARELRNRYADMADVIADLDRVERGEEPLNVRSGSTARSGGRRPGRPARLAGVALCLAAVAVGTWWFRPNAPALPPRPIEQTGRITVPGIWNWFTAHAGEYDGDGEPDIFVSQDDTLFIISEQGQVMRWQVPSKTAELFSLPYRDRFFLDRLLDVNGDGQDEVFVSWTEGTNLFLKMLNQNMLEVRQFTATGSLNRLTSGLISHSQIHFAAISDLNADGRRELLATVITGYGKKPRGLYCFDFETGTPLWQFATAPLILGMVIADLNGDENLEIVLGSDAVDNENAEADGTDDHHCYFYALSHEGRLLWRREMGNYYTRASPVTAVKPPGGPAGIIGYVAASPFLRQQTGDPEVGFAVRFDSDGNIVSRYTNNAQIFDAKAIDLDLDGQDELLLTDRLGFLYCLNQKLELINKIALVPHRYSEARLYFVDDSTLPQRSRGQIFLTSSEHEMVSGLNPGLADGPLNVRFVHDSAILVLNRKLEQVAKYTVAARLKEPVPLRAFLAKGENDSIKILAFLVETAILRYRPPASPASVP